MSGQGESEESHAPVDRVPRAMHWLGLVGVCTPSVAHKYKDTQSFADTRFVVVGTQPPPRQIIICVGPHSTSISVDDAISCGVRPRTKLSRQRLRYNAAIDEGYRELCRCARATPAVPCGVPRGFPRCVLCFPVVRWFDELPGGGLSSLILSFTKHNHPPSPREHAEASHSSSPQKAIASSRAASSATLPPSRRSPALERPSPQPMSEEMSTTDHITELADKLQTLMIKSISSEELIASPRRSAPSSSHRSSQSSPVDFKAAVLLLEGNDVCADCSGTQGLNWASSNLGAHALVAKAKPKPSAPIESKFDYVRAKYERKAFHADGDGIVLSPLRQASSSAKTVTEMQVHAGIAIVKIVSGKDLLSADWNGRSDPYVILMTSSGQWAKTKVSLRNLNPVWNETLHLNIDDPTLPIKIKVMDKDKLKKDDHLGDAEISLREIEVPASKSPNHRMHLVSSLHLSHYMR
ncbi:MAG: hypothetical protein SGPRY_003817 [Prymnesium sp.]